MFPLEGHILGGSWRLMLLVCCRLAAMLGVSLLSAASLRAGPLNPNNILVSIGTPTAGGPAPSPNTVFEFTPSGTLVQKIPFSYNGGTYPEFEYLRDIVVDSSGTIDAVNGFYRLLLTRYSPSSNTFVHRTFPDWASFTGRIATYQNFIFVPDNSGDGQRPPPGGILRFDASTNTVIRLGGHGVVLGVTMGLDGRLYALYDPTGSGTQPSSLDVYNPVTGVWLYAFDIPPDTISAGGVACFAVDQSGRIFGTDGRSTVFRLNRNGFVETSKVIAPQFEELTDIELDERGSLILCSDKARVFVGDTTLTNFTSFTAISDPNVFGWSTFVTFAKHVPTATPAPIVNSTSSTLANISSRLKVETGDRVGIAGFIITGAGTKKVVLRAIGPSLFSYFGSAAIQDPTLELRNTSGTLIAFNDNWLNDPAYYDVYAKGLSPQRDEESALSRTLPAGAYTAVLRGKNNTTGIGLIEIYDVDGNPQIKLGNISTRGFVDQGDNVMIGGFIINGHASAGDGAKVVVRGIGPSLTQSGVTGALQDPTLELYNAFGWRLASNDNWKDAQQAAIQVTGLAPHDNLESAILATLSSGAYTAILRGKNSTTGVGLIEVYSVR
jgi:hypothetical protein